MFEPDCLVRPWAAARPLAVRAASLRLGASSRSPARPRRRPRAPRPGSPDSPAPSTPSVLVSPRSPARPRHRPRAPQPGSPVSPVPSTPVGPVVLRTIRLVSRPALALPPPTGTAAWPSGPSGTLHTSGACCAADDSPRLEARPGPAAADQHRGLAPPPPTGTLTGPTAPLAPRPGPPFPPTLSCGVRVLDRKFCCG